MRRLRDILDARNDRVQAATDHPLDLSVKSAQLICSGLAGLAPGR